MEALKREAPDEEKLTALLDHYELRALKERVKKSNFVTDLFGEPIAQEKNNPAPKATKTGQIQGSLFYFFEEDSTAE